jgi:hypothetical protein
LLSQGYSNKLIADKLEISIDTVCSHLKHVFEKLHVNSRTEAAIRYMASKSAPPTFQGNLSGKDSNGWILPDSCPR